MAAGDLLTGNCQQELRGVLLGKGTVWDTEPPGPSGLGEPQVKKNDVPLGHAPGQYQGRDYPDLRVITIPYTIFAQADPTTAGTRLVALKALWAASQTDIPLHLQEPGFGHFAVVGRPRGLIEDRTLGYLGFIRALATFEAGDPTLWTAPGTPTIGVANSGPGSGQVTVAHTTTGSGQVTGVIVTPYIAGVAQTPQTFNDVLLTHTLVGLTNGTNYTFKVAAFNPAFTSAQSAASNSRPAGAPTVPGVPTSPVAAAGGSTGQMACTWVTPASDGGSALTGYIVYAFRTSDNANLGTTAVPVVNGITITLTSGVPSYFKVAAVNAVGTGTQSAASNNATPP